MQEIISPIGNPAKKWVLLNSYQLAARFTGKSVRIWPTKVRHPHYWIGAVEGYYLDADILTLKSDKLITCRIIKIFGRDVAMQDWGFEEDAVPGKLQRAVYVAGKWFLMDEGEAVEIIVPDHPPYKEISVVLHHKGGQMTQIYKKPPI